MNHVLIVDDEAEIRESLESILREEDYIVTTAATSAEALELLRDEPRRNQVKARLAGIIATLGGPGASRRAAEAILKIL